jgi:hypothetical protein
MTFRKVIWLAVGASVLTSSALAAGANAKKEFGQSLKDKYKGAQVTVMVSGMYAGEFKKDLIGKERYDAVAWQHFDESLPLKAGKTILDQIDDRTVATGGAGLHGGEVGTNIFPLEKGEQLVVSETRLFCYRGACQFTLYLVTMKLSRVASLDPRKEGRSTMNGSPLGPLFETSGLGCQFTIHFSEALSKSGDTQPVIDSLNKYLLPSALAGRVLKEANNIEINLGITEEEVRKKLGEPLKSITVGTRKSLKYTDLTVILEDGKVTEVKLQ